MKPGQKNSYNSLKSIVSTYVLESIINNNSYLSKEGFRFLKSLEVNIIAYPLVPSLN